MRNILLMKMLLAVVAVNVYAYEEPTVSMPFSDDPKSFLLIGNSFMYYNNSMHKPLLGIHNSINNNTINIKARTFYINGSTLSWHDVESYVNNPNAGAFKFNSQNKIEPFKDRSYDIAIMQDCSQCPIHPELSSDFHKYVKQHAQTLRNHNIEPVLMMTWAYKSQPSMIEAIAQEYTVAGNENKLLIIPAGLAFSRSMQSHPEIDLYADDKHPSREGTYLAAATIYASIFQASPVGNTYKFGIEKGVREKLQRIAWETYLGYYQKK